METVVLSNQYTQFYTDLQNIQNLLRPILGARSSVLWHLFHSWYSHIRYNYNWFCHLYPSRKKNQMNHNLYPKLITRHQISAHKFWVKISSQRRKLSIFHDFSANVQWSKHKVFAWVPLCYVQYCFCILSKV